MEYLAFYKAKTDLDRNFDICYCVFKDEILTASNLLFAVEILMKKLLLEIAAKKKL